MKYKLSIITTIVLLVTSFLPVLQVVLITINGGLVAFITQKNFTFQYVVNGLGAALFLVVYYLSAQTKFRLFGIIGFLFFFFPMVSYATEKIMPQDPYFLGIMLIGLLSGIIFLSADILKFKLE